MKAFLDYAYTPLGEDKDNALSFDIYAPEDSTRDENLPVVVYVHGGAWTGGDKVAVHLKPKMFCEAGFIFASINYRLIPRDVSPENGTQRILPGTPDHTVQGRDVARAISWIRGKCSAYGGNFRRVFLMGHSSGAHLVSLVATDEQLFGRFGTRLHVVRGVISLDTAVYDIPAMMKANPTEIYTHVFGKDPEVWADASPATHVRLGKKIPPFLVVYASKMPAREYQSAHFVAKLREADIPADLYFAPDKTHGSVNQELGKEGDETTEVVMRFLKDYL